MESPSDQGVAREIGFYIPAITKSYPQCRNVCVESWKYDGLPPTAAGNQGSNNLTTIGNNTYYNSINLLKFKSCSFYQETYKDVLTAVSAYYFNIDNIKFIDCLVDYVNDMFKVTQETAITFPHTQISTR